MSDRLTQHTVRFKDSLEGQSDPRMWVQETLDGGADLFLSLTHDQMDRLNEYLPGVLKAGKQMNLQHVVAQVLAWDTTEDEDGLIWEFSDAGTSVQLPELADDELRRALAERTLLLEKTVARHPFDLGAATTGLMIRNKPARAEHKVATAIIVKLWFEAGRSLDLIATVPLGRFCHALGYPSRGGRQYQRARDLVRELHGAIVGAEWSEDGELVDEGYSIIQAHRVKSGPAGSVTVRLGQDFADRVADPRTALTYIDEEMVRAFRLASPRSDTALLLWLWLESEKLYAKKEWSWRTFVAPEGEPEPPGYHRCVATTLGLYGASRKKVVGRIRKAARLVMELDPRYIIEVVPAKGRGMWNLIARRTASLPAADPCTSASPNAEVVYERVPDPCTSASPNGVRARPPEAPGDNGDSPANHEQADEPTNIAPVGFTVGSTSLTHTPDFDLYYKTHPRAVQEKSTRAAWDAAIADGADPKQVVKAAELYAAFVADQGIPPRFVKASATFLVDEYWRAKLQELTPEPTRDDGPIRCHRCGAVLGPDDRDDEKLTTVDDRGWCHIHCPGAA